MSALAITVAALLADARITAQTTTDRIYPIKAPPFTGTTDQHPTEIVVNLIHEDDECLLSGSSEYAEARVTIESRSSTARTAIDLGEIVKKVLQQIQGRSLAGKSAWFFKEGTDSTGYDDRTGVCVRTIDFYVRWR